MLEEFGKLAFSAILVCAVFPLTTARAATYYIRTDGGTAAQCTGLANAAYSGSRHQACAWNSPMEALPPTAKNQPMKPRIAGGDTLVIAPGSYGIGYSAQAVAAFGSNLCDANYSYDCVPQAVPSGPDPQHPTIIKGASCTAKPELWGMQGASHVLSLDGSSNVTLECLELTDHSACIVFYKPDPAGACNRNWGADVGAWASTGIHARDSGDVTLRDLNIHGFASSGVNAGRLRDWTVERVTIRANGWSGWDGDLGGNDHSSANSGKLVFDQLTIAWSGCTENYPASSVIHCWGQNEGGYGDGFAEAWTGGDWVFTRANIHDNTQDGLDLLYNNGTGSTKVVQSRFSGNAGNQIKISGPSSIVNSVVVGNCMWTQQKAGTTMLGAMQAADDCRALGSAVEVDFPLSNQLAALAFDTITGQGDGLVDASQSGKGNKVALANDILDGRHSDKRGDEPTFGYYGGDDNAVAVSWIGNLVHGVRHGGCPGDSICQDPMLRDPAFASYDPAPRPGSSAIAAASSKVVVATDFYGHPRPVRASIGAVEYAPLSLSRSQFRN